MSVGASLLVKSNISVSAVVGLLTPSAIKDQQDNRAWTDGSSSQNMNVAYALAGTLTAGQSSTLTLTGLLDITGASFNFTKLKMIVLYNTGAILGPTILFGGPNATLKFNTNSTASQPILGGGVLAWADPGYDGIAVTAATSDKLVLTNNHSANNTSYELYLGGVG